MDAKDIFQLVRELGAFGLLTFLIVYGIPKAARWIKTSIDETVVEQNKLAETRHLSIAEELKRQNLSSAEELKRQTSVLNQIKEQGCGNWKNCENWKPRTEIKQ